MVSRVVDIVLLALIGISLARDAHSIPVEPNNLVLKTHLQCSDITADIIEIFDNQFLSVENPCIIRAQHVRITNNTFPSSQQAFNITGPKVEIEGNIFIGAEQDHYVVGDIVQISNNKFFGELQLHEVAGYRVTLAGNEHIGNWQLHQSTALILIRLRENQSDSKYKKSEIYLDNYQVLQKYYGNELSNSDLFDDWNYKDSITIKKLGKPKQNYYVPTGKRLRFAKTVFSRSKIQRHVDSPIFDELINVLNKLE